ncbi:MAG: tetratricopeptide repeat protein [Chitinispirillaceae bacterium]|nr:tetratricopeptide repeat protein [Chitinispirillaceae bacterium]
MASESIQELFSKAQFFRKSGDNQKALAILREIVRREPSNAEALSNIGLLLYEMDDIDAAIATYRQSLAVNNSLPEVYCNLGTALLSKGDLAGAKKAFQDALHRKKGFVVALIGLGSVNHAVGDLESAKRHFVEALRIQPGDATAHFKLGAVMREWDRLDMAITCFRNTLRFRPENGVAYTCLGESLQASGRIEESEVCFRKAIELDPGNHLAWSNLFLSMNYNPAYSPIQIAEAHRKWGEELCRAAAGSGEGPVFPKKNETNRTLNLGYLSSDFCRHPAASFLEPLLENHDPSQFKVFCYSQGRIRDAKTERFRLIADQWRDIRELADEQVRAGMLQDKIDILIDCTGHMADNRLPVLARRIAPVQVSWIGYPNTTGLPTIDYRFGDETTDPVTEEPPCTERIVRLPNCFCCYAPPSDAPEVGDPPAAKNGFVTFGSLHTPARLNSEVIRLWSKALARAPGSRLLVFRTLLNDEIIARLVDRFALEGIDPARIDFVREVPPQGHLEIYRRIDVMLDTLPWSGHASACEALWMGVPVITMRGDRYAGRMVASVLTQLGLEDFIAESPEEFCAIAVKMAQEITSLGMLRNGLRELMDGSPLCDARAFTLQVEHEYRRMWLKSRL